MNKIISLFKYYEMKDKPSYYGILPAKVRYDKRLKPMAKIMYSELTALSNKHGFCSANNHYFAELYGVSKATVSRWISQLSANRYIRIEITASAGNDRKIYPNDQNVNTYVQKDQEGIDKKINTPIDKKIKYNNTSNNTTSVNTNNVLKTEFEEFWNLYSKKVGKRKSWAKWQKLKPAEKELIFAHVPKYVESTPDETYRKHPLTYLNGECWNDDIILPRSDKNQSHLTVKKGKEYYEEAERAAKNQGIQVIAI